MSSYHGCEGACSKIENTNQPEIANSDLLIQRSNPPALESGRSSVVPPLPLPVQNLPTKRLLLLGLSLSSPLPRFFVKNNLQTGISTGGEGGKREREMDGP